MEIFDNINVLEADFLRFTNELNLIHEKLYNICPLEIQPITKVRDKFILKTNDFIKKDRKLNIGVIGQIKTGRSTFLNTLIFGGQDVLPKAVTPKTAIVTKIIYNQSNFIEVEYYSNEEIQLLNIEVSPNIHLDYYLKLSKQKINCKSYSELKNLLNDFISENGKLTCIVKFVTIHINNDKLKDICIIDTPGLNDPVLSRSNKTKEFLEICDVVFFLSRSSHFLDKNDVDLLYSQLPKKGVKKLSLICSRYDDGLNDTIMDYESLESADKSTKNKLRKHAKKVYSEINYSFNEKNTPVETLTILKSLESPIFISSLAHNMSIKDMHYYSDSEVNIFENLNFHKDLTAQSLKDIGDFSEIESLLTKVINKKEETLIMKSKSFIPDSNMELLTALDNINNIFKKRIHLLSSINKSDLQIQKDNMIAQTNSISANLNNTFLELYILIDESKMETLKEVKKARDKSYSLKEKSSTQTKSEVELSSDSKWFRPSSWGKKKQTNVLVNEDYSYLDPADALNQLKNYANLCSDTIEDSFVTSLEVESLRQKLLEVVVENHDTSDENYDPFFFKLIVSKTLDSLVLPSININISNLLNIVSTKFSDKVKSTDDMISLKILLVVCINSFIKDLQNTFSNELDTFKKQLNNMKEEFYSKLLENVTNEYDLILLKYNNRENEIKNYSDIILKIKDLQTKLPKG